MKQLRVLFFLFAANIISGFAQGITMLAIPWYLIGQPAGKLLNASMVAVVTVLSLFWGMYAGTLVDKYNRKKIFLSLNGIDACILLSIAGIGFWLGDLPFALVALVYTITIFTYNVHYPNLYAFVQELFEPHLYARVNSAIEIMGQTTSFIGMMVGGILLDGTVDLSWWPETMRFEAWTLPEIFLLDGCTYILGFFLLYQIPYRPSASKVIDQGRVLNRMKQGYRYLVDRPDLLLFGIASHVIFFSLLVMIQVVSPIYVKDYLQEQAVILSSFKGVYSLGAISAGIVGFIAIVRRGNIIRQIIGLLLLAGVLFVVLSVTQSVLLTLMSAYLLGVANAGARIRRITYLVRIVPNRIIGRVNSFLMVINVMMRASFFVLLTIPFFADEANGGNVIYATFLLSGIMFLSAIFMMIRYRKFDHEAAVGE
ncbi:MAG: MFS transporter [Bacteroidota bacterium]